MGGFETVDPSAVRDLASTLDSTLTPTVAAARDEFDETDVNGPAFSDDGPELWVTYPGVQHFALRDLQSKAQQLESIVRRLNSTATSWSDADRASTIRSH